MHPPQKHVVCRWCFVFRKNFIHHNSHIQCYSCCAASSMYMNQFSRHSLPWLPTIFSNNSKQFKEAKERGMSGHSMAGFVLISSLNYNIKRCLNKNIGSTCEATLFHNPMNFLTPRGVVGDGVTTTTLCVYFVVGLVLLRKFKYWTPQTGWRPIYVSDPFCYPLADTIGQTSKQTKGPNVFNLLYLNCPVSISEYEFLSRTLIIILFFFD